jgi:hypothetical protein
VAGKGAGLRVLLPEAGAAVQSNLNRTLVSPSLDVIDSSSKYAPTCAVPGPSLLRVFRIEQAGGREEHQTTL